MPMPYQLKNMYNEGQFEDIMELAKISEELQTFCEWDYFYYMNAAYKLQRYEECINIFNSCRKRFPKFDILNDRFGWALYHTSIKRFNKECDNVQKYKNQLLFIINNCKQSEYSPLWMAVNCLIKAYKENIFGKKIDYKLINLCLDKISPEELDTKEHIFNHDGKVIRMASDMEVWYSYKVKALKELGSYKECIKLAFTALKKLKNFHDNSNLWMMYRAGYSFYELRKYDDAKKCLDYMISSEYEHFLVWELMYKVKKDLGEHEEAIRCGALLALSNNNHKMRVNFYLDYGEFLYRQGFVREAMLHRQLTVRLREENNWNAKNFQSDWSVADDIERMSAKEILQQLQSFWREKRDAGKVRLQGKIKNMLASGRDGFILGDNGQSYYFQLRDIEGRYGRLEDARVSFIVTERMDKKKNVVKENAYRIIVEG